MAELLASGCTRRASNDSSSQLALPHLQIVFVLFFHISAPLLRHLQFLVFLFIHVGSSNFTLILLEYFNEAIATVVAAIFRVTLRLLDWLFNLLRLLLSFLFSFFVQSFFTLLLFLFALPVLSLLLQLRLTSHDHL